MIWEKFLGIFENDRGFITACTEIFCGILLGILTWNLYRRYKQHPNVALRYLTFTTLFLGLASVLQTLDQFIFVPYTQIKSFGYGLAFGVSAIGNIFMAFFMLEIFMSGRASGGAKYTIFTVVEGAVAVLSPIMGPFSDQGQILEMPFLIVLVIHLVFSIGLYVTFIRVTSDAMRKTGDAITRKGFAFLRAGGITIISAYTSFILDRVWLIKYGITYSFWVILGWVFAAITGIMLYQGFVYPTKMRPQEESGSKKETTTREQEQEQDRIEKP